MKKIVVPAILAATVLIAGMFAVMPVQKASTVHSSFGALAQTAVNNAVPTITASVNTNTNAARDAINTNTDTEAEQVCEDLLTALDAEGVVTMTASEIDTACS